MEVGSSSSNGSSKGVIVVVEKQGMRFENPFSLKVGQVFTGVGFGCGLGIGVGRPLNLGTQFQSHSLLVFLGLEINVALFVLLRFIINVAILALCKLVKHIPSKRYESTVTFIVGWRGRSIHFKMNFGGFFKPKDSKVQNHSAIPMLNQVMAATGGATDALSGVTRHVNQSLRKLGAKNIQAGIGCGVGLGHGFGVGLAIKPGVLHQIQAFAMQTVTKMIMKFGVTPDLSIAQGLLPQSLQSGITKGENPTSQNPIENLMQLATKSTGNNTQDGSLNTVTAVETSVSKISPARTSYESRTEKVLNSFLQSPLLKDDDRKSKDLADGLQSENNMLHMVLKHQVVIDELREENERLRRILVEDLKIPASKLKTTSSSTINSSPCSDCFECRRKQRKR